MYQIPIGSNPIPDPAGFGAAFTSDAVVGFAAWLAIAAIAYLELLPLALRRRRGAQTTANDVELSRAA